MKLERRVRVVAEGDVKLVEAAVARHAHLRGYMVRVVRSAIVIFEPHPKPAELREVAQRQRLRPR
jgi:hypothetical protein